jgi:hypothetical protein
MNAFKLPQMLIYLESIGFNLYYDDQTGLWECMSEEEIYFATDSNKEEAIRAVFYHVINSLD